MWVRGLCRLQSMIQKVSSAYFCQSRRRMCKGIGAQKTKSGALQTLLGPPTILPHGWSGKQRHREGEQLQWLLLSNSGAHRPISYLLALDPRTTYVQAHLRHLTDHLLCSSHHPSEVGTLSIDQKISFLRWQSWVKRGEVTRSRPDS